MPSTKLIAHLGEQVLRQTRPVLPMHRWADGRNKSRTFTILALPHRTLAYCLIAAVNSMGWGVACYGAGLRSACRALIPSCPLRVWVIQVGATLAQEPIFSIGGLVNSIRAHQFHSFILE